MKGKVALHNLGCKVNAYETEAMQQMLEAAGYEIVPFEPGADIYVINTCTVTNIADRKSRQMLHKAKKMNPDAIVVAAGCYVQADTKKAEADGADYIGCGAIYPTKTHVKTKITKVEVLNEICNAVSIPVAAIGGLKKDNLSILKDIPIQGVCVVSAIMDAEDTKKASEELLEEVHKILHK